MTAEGQTRYLLIDFLRGVALMVIFVDHLALLTTGRFGFEWIGFSDAAELFVFLSGFVCGIVYSRVYDRGGLLAVVKKSLKRCSQVYLAYLLAMGAVVLVISLEFVCGQDLAVKADVILFFTEPGKAILLAVVLGYVPWHFHILSTYVVILFFLPFMLYLMRRSLAQAVGVSAAIWFVVLLFPDINLPMVDGQWFFNPFSWQFIFVLGMVFGGLVVKSTTAPRPNPILVVLAVAIILYAFVNNRLPSAFWRLGLVDADSLSSMAVFPFPLTEKTTLQPLRLIHFGCAVYLFVVFGQHLRWLWTSRLMQPLVWAGQFSLQVFALGLVIDYILTLALCRAGGGAALQLLFYIVGCSASLIFAVVLKRRSDRRRLRLSG